MSKLTILRSQATPARLAAIALACTLAAGCSMNQNPGGGEPTRGGAGAGPSVPTSTPGTFYRNPPMISSYRGQQAAAVLRNDAAFSTRYLGPAAPGSGEAVNAGTAVQSGTAVQMADAGPGLTSSGPASAAASTLPPVWARDESGRPLSDGPQSVVMTGVNAINTPGSAQTTPVIAATSSVPARNANVAPATASSSPTGAAAAADALPPVTGKASTSRLRVSRAANGDVVVTNQ